MEVKTALQVVHVTEAQALLVTVFMSICVSFLDYARSVSTFL